MTVRLASARILTTLTATVLALWAVVTGAGLIHAEWARPVPAAEINLQQRRDALTQMLSTRPMAAQSWVALAALRNVLAMPPASVDAAFLMSSVTGPAEGDVMAQRALLGLLLWETSAPETQERVLSDLCGLVVYDSARLRLVLSGKSEAVRTTIRTGLTGQGCAARMIASIGL